MSGIVARIVTCRRWQLNLNVGQAIKEVFNVEGKGRDYHDAQKDAFKKAIEQTYGVDISSFTTVKNFSEVTDTIIATHKGYIQATQGEQIEQKDGIYVVKYASIKVSESIKGIEKEITDISNTLQFMSYPSIGIKKENVNDEFINYLEGFIVNRLGIEVVTESEYTICPHVEIVNIDNTQTLKVRGSLINRQGNVASSCGAFTLRYFGFSDYNYAAYILAIELLRQIRFEPMLTVTNVENALDAIRLGQNMGTLPSVKYCELKQYFSEEKKAAYKIGLKSNVTNLFKEAINSNWFHSSEGIFFEPAKRVLQFKFVDGTVVVVTKEWFEQYQKEPIIVSIEGNKGWQTIYQMKPPENGLYWSTCPHPHGYGGSFLLFIHFNWNASCESIPVLKVISSGGDQSGYQFDWQITKDGRVQTKHQVAGQSIPRTFVKIAGYWGK